MSPISVCVTSGSFIGRIGDIQEAPFPGQANPLTPPYQGDGRTEQRAGRESLPPDKGGRGVQLSEIGKNPYTR